MHDAPARYSVKLDPDLIPTDRLLKTWAAGEGKGARSPMHPLERIRLLHDGAVLGGAAPLPKEVEICDLVVRTSPDRERLFIVTWYRDGSPVYLKAARLGMHRSTMYTELGKTLSFIRGRLHGHGVKV
jgi:hypothetical protein